MDHSFGSGVAPFGMYRLSHSEFYQPVESAVDEGPPDGENPSHVALGGKSLGDGESVGVAFCQEAKDGVLG